MEQYIYINVFRWLKIRTIVFLLFIGDYLIRYKVRIYKCDDAKAPIVCVCLA